MNSFWEGKDLRKNEINVVQINMGNLCNLACRHCHVGASPAGSDNMDRETAEKISQKLRGLSVRRVEFTGGEPILNPNLAYFIEELSGLKEVVVRTNLVSMDMPEYHDLIRLFKQNDIVLAGSLPSPFRKATDSQRGEGVFEKSLRVLKRLNHEGYGCNGLKLDLVYNPTGDYLPTENLQLESDYRHILRDSYGVSFNDLITMVNVPIRRFRSHLEKNGTLTVYEKELKEQYNPATLDLIMCRSLLSVDYQGYVYDCDFNLAVGKRIKGCENSRLWEIDFDNFDASIGFGDYCYACTVNRGSSCHGTLIKDGFDVKKNVMTYYGETLGSSQDLHTNACCTTDFVPEHVREGLRYVNDEIKAKYYGCGSPIPQCIEGLKVLDVGCGTGRDVYILSHLTGESGFAWGIDMTENQLDVARKYIDEQMDIFGYSNKNVGFILDYIENLEDHFEEESLDLIISNCVINLVEDKELVFQSIFNILKTGGEFYFADVYADRRAPEHIMKNDILYGECLGGALYYNDFKRIAKKVGFIDPRVVSDRKIDVSNPQIEKLVENITFNSITHRLWKLEGLEDACEDYGHIAVYRGGIPSSPFRFELDREHIFYKNRPVRVCGNTSRMLEETRFGSFFEIIGDFSEHFGEFEDCGRASREWTEGVDSRRTCC
ncbi:MAG: arsenosugar biosynthesis radical SAM protein ArsS [Thermodesulfobacteriota bacterium]|nr:arsenosugar biosynthesis radical SAM protein ArsS [Thermodesulfobacteriota bacterium]